MKKLITEINTSNEFIGHAQIKWEFLKYESRKFMIDYSKTAAKIRKKKQQSSNIKQEQINLENKLASKENKKLYSY